MIGTASLKIRGQSYQDAEADVKSKTYQAAGTQRVSSLSSVRSLNLHVNQKSVSLDFSLQILFKSQAKNFICNVRYKLTSRRWKRRPQCTLSAIGSLPQGGGGWQWGYKGTDIAALPRLDEATQRNLQPKKTYSRTAFPL